MAPSSLDIFFFNFQLLKCHHKITELFRITVISISKQKKKHSLLGTHVYNFYCFILFYEECYLCQDCKASTSYETDDWNAQNTTEGFGGGCYRY